MTRPFGGDMSGFGADLGEQLIQDLERQDLDTIRSLRTQERIDIVLDVVLEPANSSDRSGDSFRGKTRDLSRGGTSAMFESPVGVGDVFRLTFEANSGIPMVFARCLRCRLVRENAFEAGFRFFSDVEVTAVQAADKGLPGDP